MRSLSVSGGQWRAYLRWPNPMLSRIDVQNSTGSCGDRPPNNICRARLDVGVLDARVRLLDARIVERCMWKCCVSLVATAHVAKGACCVGLRCRLQGDIGTHLVDERNMCAQHEWVNLGHGRAVQQHPPCSARLCRTAPTVGLL